VFERAYAKPHPNLINAHTILGSLARKTGDLDTALSAHEQAVALLDAAAIPTGHSLRVNTLAELGYTLAARRDHLGAARVLGRAEAMMADGNVPPQWAGEVRFGLARALVASRGDRRRARTLATRAREDYASVGAPFAPQVAEIDAWLASSP
jgi:hypothetical protein